MKKIFSYILIFAFMVSVLVVGSESVFASDEDYFYGTEGSGVVLSANSVANFLSKFQLRDLTASHIANRGPQELYDEIKAYDADALYTVYRCYMPDKDGMNYYIFPSNSLDSYYDKFTSGENKYYIKFKENTSAWTFQCYESDNSVYYNTLDFKAGDVKSAGWSRSGTDPTTYYGLVCEKVKLGNLGASGDIGSDDSADSFFNNAEKSFEVGSLKNVRYKYLMEKIPTGHKVYYKFDWDTVTSTNVNLSKDNYDVIYYWECSADVVSLFGNATHIDSLYSDKYFVKEKSDRFYGITEYAFEGDLYDIYSEICDKQPLVCRSFKVNTVLHVAPIYKGEDERLIGAWTHIKFDNTMNADTITEVLKDEFDGNGLEQEYDIDVEESDGSISSSSHSSTVGVGNTLQEAEHKSDLGNSTSLSQSSYEDMKGTLNEFVGATKAFSSLIASVLGFLPSWAIKFIIASIVISGLMIIKRAIF